MSADPFTLPAGTPPARAFDLLHEGRHRLAPVVVRVRASAPGS